MAVTQTFSRKSYVGGAAGTAYDFETKVFATSEITVLVKDTLTGLVTTLTEGAGADQYAITAVSGNLDNGVSVTTTDSYIPTDQLTLIRTIAETQTLELEEGGDMPANELEDALDRGIMISQQILDGGERHITHPATDPISTTYNVPTSELRADKVLGYDSFGNVTTLTPTDIGSVAADNAAGVEILNTSTEADDVTIEINVNSKYAIKALGVDTAQLAAGAVELAKIDSAILSGSDATLVTGTAGTTDTYAKWDANGDAIQGPAVADIATVALVEALLASNYMLVVDEKTSGSAGQSLTAATWNIRELNDKKVDAITGASLTANQITLPAGTYDIKASAGAMDIDGAASESLHKTAIYDTTGSSYLAYGLNSRNIADATTNATFTYSNITARITLGVESVLELRHYVSSSSSGGFAISQGVETYASVEIRKL